MIISFSFNENFRDDIGNVGALKDEIYDSLPENIDDVIDVFEAIIDDENNSSSEEEHTISVINSDEV